MPGSSLLFIDIQKLPRVQHTSFTTVRTYHSQLGERGHMLCLLEWRVGRKLVYSIGFGGPRGPEYAYAKPTDDLLVCYRAYLLLGAYFQHERVRPLTVKGLIRDCFMVVNPKRRDRSRDLTRMARPAVAKIRDALTPDVFLRLRDKPAESMEHQIVSLSRRK